MGWEVDGGPESKTFVLSLIDRIFVPKFLILDSKSETNFGPRSHKNGRAWSLIQKNTADPDPMACLIPDPGTVIPP